MVLFKDFDKLDDKMQGKFNRDILLKGLMIFLEKDNIKVTLKSPLIFYKKPVFFVIYLSMFFLDKAQKHQSLTGLYKNAGSQYKRANEFP